MEKEELLDQVLARSPGGAFSEADMQLLAQLFPPAIVSIALEAAFSKGVVCVTASCGRTALEFCFGGTRHLLYLSPRLFCTCDTFCEGLAQGWDVLCKHLLAAKIAVSARLVQVEKVGNADFADRCLQSVKFP